MKTTKPRQLGMTLVDPGLPPMESYCAVLLEARVIGRDPAAQQIHLDRALVAGRICRTDAQCIWRGVFRVWKTPFDL